MTIAQPVTVDAGDLEEGMAAATAWAAQLRLRAQTTEAPHIKIHRIQTADRIDRAVARLMQASYDSRRAA